MKNLSLLVFCTLLFLIASSQKKNDQFDSLLLHRKFERCGTEEVIKKMIEQNPGLPLKWKTEGDKLYKLYQEKHFNTLNKPSVNDTIIIPVVFHLIGSDSILNSIPDRDVYGQIEILNHDYHGEKADKYKGLFAPEFEKRVAKLNLKFVLARRTPSGQLTDGIERRVIDSTFTRNTYQKAKHFASGGLDVWNSDKYLNVWGVIFTDNLLGIATFPFSADADEQGVEISLYTIGANTCRKYYPQYNEGATLSHEVGHYFYLWHTWSDDNGACGDKDFKIQEGYTLPDSALVDDTPDEAGSDDTNFGNLSGIYTDKCSSSSPGIMYMDFMNYYDDRALFMFSKGQEKRILAAIDIYRPGLKNTNGYIPPFSVTDAYLVSMAPFGGCDSHIPVVNNTPIVSYIRNNGTSSLVSLTLNLKVDGNLVENKFFNLNLDPGSDTSLILPYINFLQGNHTLQLYTSAPNGDADNFLSNDTLTSYINVRNNKVSVPLFESFTSNTFPPAGWTINNAQDSTWRWIADAGYTGAGAATVQNFNYPHRGQIDELITPPIDFGTSDSALLSFQVANAQYSATTTELDGLEVYISEDGGQTYKLVYKKVANELKTVPDVHTDNFNPLLDKFKWRKETINLTNFIVKGQSLIIKFRNVTAYGNNTYLDDISVSGVSFTKRDVYAKAIENIPDLLCNTNFVQPRFSFGSNWRDTLKELTINYQLDNGNIDSVKWTGNLTLGQSDTISLNEIKNISPGTHAITVFLSNPNNLPDLNSANDTLKKRVIIVPLVHTPISEGFEKSQFPPENWFILNPDDDITWERTTSVSKSGAASMVIRNFDYSTSNTTDRFISSIINPANSNYDSLFVSFDYAYRPGKSALENNTAPLDTLELQLSKDCGISNTTLFKKWGEDLQTVVANSSDERFVPVIGEWKNARVYLTPFVGDQSFQLSFVAESNNQNNLYIDNINVFGKILPQRLKEQGFLIYPSPFINSFIVRNLQAPTQLKSINVYNSIGQLVYSNRLNGTGNTEITIDMSSHASGVYIVKLNYEDKTVVQKILKIQ